MSTATQVPLIPEQIEATMQSVTLLALGIDPASVGAFSQVRVGWQTQGQPSQNVKEDVVYVRAVEEDDPYNQIRDSLDVVNDTTTIQQITTYTRVWRVFWSAYGPSCFDSVRKIKSALLRPSQPIHDLLTTKQLYLVTQMTTARRVPYEFMGQWWERTDFDAVFNEFVTESEIVGTVGSAEVIVETADGIFSDKVYHSDGTITPGTTGNP